MRDQQGLLGREVAQQRKAQQARADRLDDVDREPVAELMPAETFEAVRYHAFLRRPTAGRRPSAGPDAMSHDSPPRQGSQYQTASAGS